MSERTLIDLIKKQINIEKGFVSAVEKEIKDTHNIAARLLLLETQKDSEKHALILKGILEVVCKKDAKPLWDTLIESYVDKLVVKKSLENHIRTEKQMLEHILVLHSRVALCPIRLLVEVLDVLCNFLWE